jgi:hypothetical protein
MYKILKCNGTSRQIVLAGYIVLHENEYPMPQHGAGFLVRSLKHQERVATLEDLLHQRLEHSEEVKQ